MSRLDIKNFNDELYQKLQDLSSKNGKSIKELVEEAVRLYVLGTESIDKPIKSVVNKVITVRFDTKCVKCKKDIRANELAYWVKYEYEDGTVKSYVYCMDCYLSEHDESLAKQYLKIRKLKAEIRGLEKIRDRLASEIEDLEINQKLIEAKRWLVDVINTLRNAVIEGKEMDKLTEIAGEIDRISKELAELEFLVKSRKVKVKVKPYAREHARK